MGHEPHQETDHTHGPDDTHDDAPHAHMQMSDCGSCACSLAAAPAAPAPANRGRHAEVWYIPNMDCPVEEKEIRQALSGISGIRLLTFHLSSRTLTIEASDEVREKAREAISRAGFAPRQREAAKAGAGGHGHDHGHAETGYVRPLLAFALALGAEAIHFFLPESLPVQILIVSLALFAIGLSGWSVYLNGMRALLRGRLNINALMAVAVTGACLIGQWAEAAMVMVLYAIAELIEARSVDRARNTIRGLFGLAPDTAELRQPDGSWKETDVKTIVPGQVIRVKPGERIPLDGSVLAGYSVVDQAAITGESVPVGRGTGDEVFAGTINQSGILELNVIALAEDTMLARIITAVEQAQETRAPTQRFIDRFAAVYTPAVFLVALAVAIGLPLLAGWAWLDAVYRALVLLVIACPCALVIATPLTVVSGLAAGARAGILIKGGVYLEEARKLKAVAMDKTGTITEGRPKLVAIEMISINVTRTRIQELAATMASLSSHPVSKAIAEGLHVRLGMADSFAELPGRGSEGVVDGRRLRLGSPRWIAEGIPASQFLRERLAAHEASGYSVTLLASPTEVLALFAVADTIRANSWQAVDELACRKIMPVMLTGDNDLTAKTIATQAGIREVHSNLLPEGKQVVIDGLQEKYRHVAMVGDGINDAPALAAADIGIAMGGAGSDIAMETADVVIMNDDLRRVIDLVRLSRRTFRILRQNIMIALGIKFVFLVLALTGHATMWMAIFADVGATLIVVFNALRMLRWRSRFGSG